MTSCAFRTNWKEWYDKKFQKTSLFSGRLRFIQNSPSQSTFTKLLLLYSNGETIDIFWKTIGEIWETPSAPQNTFIKCLHPNRRARSPGFNSLITFSTFFDTFKSYPSLFRCALHGLSANLGDIRFAVDNSRVLRSRRTASTILSNLRRLCPVFKNSHWNMSLMSRYSRWTCGTCVVSGTYIGMFCGESQSQDFITIFQPWITYYFSSKEYNSCWPFLRVGFNPTICTIWNKLQK